MTTRRSMSGAGSTSSAPGWKTRPPPRAEVMAMYGARLLERPQPLGPVDELRAKTPACRRAPEPCHAHVPAEPADAP